MKKGTIKIVALVGAVLVTILVVSLMTGRTNKDLMTNMGEVSLPVVTLYKEDIPINELYGYTTKMEASTMRDTITPLNQKRILPIKIQTFDDKVDGISYEIRSMDGERLIAEKEWTDYTQKDGVISADIKVQNIIEEGKEYLFVLKLEQGSKEIYYYTRLMQPVDSYVDESLEFVMDFHNKSMNKETGGTLATYLEPDSAADNNTLSDVTIHSSLSQLTWGKLDYEQLAMPIPSIKEISSSANVITLNYVVTTKGSEDQTEYYNVEEYYRVRHTADRVYLLDYERKMNQIFRGEKSSVNDKYLQLGICGRNVNYVSNESGTAVAFVQEGELWGYNQNTGQIAKIFSFRGKDEIEKRENYNQHDIRIVDVDEEGSVDFLVYGYMNRGVHEGKVGISVCRYDSVANTTEEELFLPVETSYQVMKEDLRGMAYRNNQKEFFILAGKDLYKIQMDSMEVSTLKKNLEEGTYGVSDSGRYFVYKEKEMLHLEDLENGSVYKIKPENGECLKPLGFMGEDLIYGISTGEEMPMHKVQIISSEEDHKVLKSYEKGGSYISGVRIEGNTIYLDRLVYQNGNYIEAESDTIMNSEEKENTQVLVHTTSDEKKQTLIQLEFPQESKKETVVKLLTPEQVVEKKPKEVRIEFQDKNQYYAYAAGRVVAGGYNPAEVVQAANGKMGVVVDGKQNYIWRRSKKTAQSNVLGNGTTAAGGSSVAQCLNLMLAKEGENLNTEQLLEEGQSVENILSNTLKNSIVLNLTGCSAEEMLYYVSVGNPVLGILDGNTAALIVGYDSTGILICHPETGSVEKMSTESANAAFEAGGNIFYSYVKEEE